MTNHNIVWKEQITPTNSDHFSFNVQHKWFSALTTMLSTCPLQITIFCHKLAWNIRSRVQNSSFGQCVTDFRLIFVVLLKKKHIYGYLLAEPTWLWNFPEVRIRKETERWSRYIHPINNWKENHKKKTKNEKTHICIYATCRRLGLWTIGPQTVVRAPMHYVSLPIKKMF